MDRKQWLTLIYREANKFVEKMDQSVKPVGVTDLEELEPEIHAQIQEVLRATEHLEDLIKHSLLKDPPRELWQNERDWNLVLVAVAGTCLTYDVKGVVDKILSGDLPRSPSQNFIPPEGESSEPAPQ